MDKMAFRVQRLVCLSHMVIVFFICRHVYNFIGDNRVCRVIVVDLTVRSLHKPILVNPCIAGQRVDQTDIRTLGRLDRAHPSVMGIMYVTNLKSGTIPGKSSWAECGQTSLVGQLTKRVILIHELGQLGGSKELLHCCRHRFNINQRLRGYPFQILGRHPLADNTLQP